MNSARKRKQLSRPSSDGASSRTLPLHRPRASAPSQAAASPVPSKCRHLRAQRTVQIAASSLIFLVLFLIGLDKLYVHRSLSSYPNCHQLVAKATQPAISINQAKIAIASLHEGWKYHGSLGQFLRDNKQSYANLHGYAYVDTFPGEADLIQLRPWQMVDNRAVYYKKPRFVLYLMEKYENLEWILWIDGDALLTQPYVSIEDRVKEFQRLHGKDKGTTSGGSSDALCLVWAEDTQPNAGVLLIRNNRIGRELMRTALNTWDDTDAFRRFTDQASLTAAVRRNATYSNCSLLLRKDRATQLQSRVRGPASWLWKPGHWILHLPNHNYLELLSSLRNVGRHLETSLREEDGLFSAYADKTKPE